MSGSALLVAAIDVPAEIEDDFTAWYDGEHVPERLTVPGIERVSRWERVSGTAPRFLALFEAAGPDVFTSGAYAALKAQGDTPWTTRIRPHFERMLRGVFVEAARFGTDDDGTACAAAFTTVPDPDEAAYRAWYEEHGAVIATVPAVSRLRRLEREDGEPRHVTIVELRDLGALESEEYAAAKAATPDPGLRGRWRREQGLYRLLRSWPA